MHVLGSQWFESQMNQLLRTVTPRDSSRDFSLSRLFYLKSFPHFSAFSAHRTSPYLSAPFRVSPFLAFPCLTMVTLLSLPFLAFCFILLSFALPFRTVHWLLRYSLCNPYIRYSVHTRY